MYRRWTDDSLEPLRELRGLGVDFLSSLSWTRPEERQKRPNLKVTYLVYDLRPTHGSTTTTCSVPGKGSIGRRTNPIPPSLLPPFLYSDTPVPTVNLSQDYFLVLKRFHCSVLSERTISLGGMFTTPIFYLTKVPDTNKSNRVFIPGYYSYR